MLNTLADSIQYVGDQIPLFPNSLDTFRTGIYFTIRSRGVQIPLFR